MDTSSNEADESAHDQSSMQDWRTDLFSNYVTLQKAHLALQKRCIKQQATIELLSKKMLAFEEHAASSANQKPPASIYSNMLRTLAKIVTKKSNEILANDPVLAECLKYHRNVHKVIRAYPETSEICEEDEEITTSSSETIPTLAQKEDLESNNAKLSPTNRGRPTREKDFNAERKTLANDSLLNGRTKSCDKTVSQTTTTLQGAPNAERKTLANDSLLNGRTKSCGKTVSQSTTTSQGAPRTAEEELVDELDLHLSEVLDLWTMHDEDGKGYEAIQRWMFISREEAAEVLKLKTKSKKSYSDSQHVASVYMTFLKTAAINLLRKTGEKYTKAQIIDKCLECHQRIRNLIIKFIESHPNTIKNPKAVKFPKVEKEAVLEKEHDELKDSTSDEEERLFLEALPDQVRQMFRQICFTKWGKNWLPVLVLSPFDVDGELREDWMRKYDKYLSNKGPHEHLIVWYGCKNYNELYGWVSELISYEHAKEKNLHLCPERLLTEIAKGKKLSTREQNIVDSFEEMEEAIELPLTDRWVRKDETGEDTTEEERGSPLRVNGKRKVSHSLHVKGDVKRLAIEESKSPEEVSNANLTKTKEYEYTIQKAPYCLETNSSLGTVSRSSATNSISCTSLKKKAVSDQSFTTHDGPPDKLSEIPEKITNVSSNDGNNFPNSSGRDCTKKVTKTAAKAKRKDIAAELLADADFISSITLTYQHLNTLLTSGSPDDIMTRMKEKLKYAKRET